MKATKKCEQGGRGIAEITKTKKKKGRGYLGGRYLPMKLAKKKLYPILTDSEGWQQLRMMATDN